MSARMASTCGARPPAAERSPSRTAPISVLCKSRASSALSATGKPMGGGLQQGLCSGVVTRYAGTGIPAAPISALASASSKRTGERGRCMCACRQYLRTRREQRRAPLAPPDGVPQSRDAFLETLHRHESEALGMVARRPPENSRPAAQAGGLSHRGSGRQRPAPRPAPPTRKHPTARRADNSALSALCRIPRREGYCRSPSWRSCLFQIAMVTSCGFPGVAISGKSARSLAHALGPGCGSSKPAALR